jgi:hypothetical protein
VITTTSIGFGKSALSPLADVVLLRTGIVLSSSLALITAPALASSHLRLTRALVFHLPLLFTGDMALNWNRTPATVIEVVFISVGLVIVGMAIGLGVNFFAESESAATEEAENFSKKALEEAEKALEEAENFSNKTLEEAQNFSNKTRPST